MDFKKNKGFFSMAISRGITTAAEFALFLKAYRG